MKTEISQMVTMLAERMRTNPEDFIHEIGTHTPKFYDIAQSISDMIADPNLKYYWFLNDTEKQILVDAYRDLCRNRFENSCMETLLGDRQESAIQGHKPSNVKNKAQGSYQATPWVDPRLLYGQREDLLRVGANENGVNQIHTSSIAQRINGALNKMVKK